MLPTLQIIAKIQSKDTRTTQSGKNVTSLRLSVGEKNTKDEYDNFYFNATFWEKSADFVGNNFKEGDLIGIKGDLITTHYEKDGRKIYQTEVKFPKAYFAPRSQSNNNATQTPPQSPQNGAYEQPTQNSNQNTENGLNSQRDILEVNIDMDSSDIPF